jgi:ribosome maturation factor RimP
MLDNETKLDEEYQLEVTTPGLERKLRRPEHYRKSVGREVVTKFQRGGTGKTVQGVITAANEEAFTVDSGEETEVVKYDDVIRAKTVFRWERAPKPGH